MGVKIICKIKVRNKTNYIIKENKTNLSIKHAILNSILRRPTFIIDVINDN